MSKRALKRLKKEAAKAAAASSSSGQSAQQKAAPPPAQIKVLWASLTNSQSARPMAERVLPKAEKKFVPGTSLISCVARIPKIKREPDEGDGPRVGTFSVTGLDFAKGSDR